MRVIAGKAKGHTLQMVPGDSTRPITDRSKEALFSILGDWIYDTRVLDLFGGTGAVGIEALSRGAEYVHFVDMNRNAVRTINTNLRHCHFDQMASVERANSFTVLEKYEGAPFDLIYVAPPQYREMWLRALHAIDERPQLLAKYGAVIVQIHPREDAPTDLFNLEEYDRRRYGSVLMIFYAAAQDLAQDSEDEYEDEDGDDVEDVKVTE